MSKEEIEHLQWIHDRIISVYGESENVDFLIKMREIIKPNMSACMLSILDSLKLYDNNSLELGDETLRFYTFKTNNLK